MQDTPSSTTTYTYDSFNRVQTVTNPQGVVQYGYDAANRRTSLNFGSDANNLKHVGYSYDGLSRPTDISTWLSATPLHYEYAGSRLDHMDYPNGVTAKYGYDDADRLKSIAQAKGTATPFYEVHYELNTLGDRKQADEKFSGVQHLLTYEYDELRRLTKETTQIAGGGQSYTSYAYDAVGNRTSATKDSISSYYNYNAADWLKCITGTAADSTCTTNVLNSFTYNKNGSLTAATSYGMGGATTLYGYDSRNRLTSWAQGNGSTARSATFEYDGAGARTHMQYTNAGNTAANTDTRYLQDATGMAEALQELNGSTRNSYLYAPGSTSPFAYDEAGTAYWYHHDALGSIRATTTATGSVQTVQSYSAFGSREVAFNNGVNSNPALDKGTHGFAGEQSDPTGLSYNRARYYDPTLGRFIQRDSVVGDPSNPLSMNLFVYTQNNPANAIDPSGNIVDRPQMTANDGGGLIDCTRNPMYCGKAGPNHDGGQMAGKAKLDAQVAAFDTAQALRTSLSSPAESDTVRAGQIWNTALNVVDDAQDLALALLVHKFDTSIYVGNAVTHIQNWDKDKVDVGYNVIRTTLFVLNFVPVGGEALQGGKVGLAGISKVLPKLGKVAEGAEDVAKLCANSFSSDTLVATDDGDKPIGDLHIGDVVLAYDEDTGTTEYDPITATITHIDPSFLDVVVDGELIHTTEHHPFYTLERGWTDAGDLQRGDHIRKADGDYGVVQHVGVVQIAKRMYNLTVQHAHTFFVGKQRWLVHNAENCLYGSVNEPGRIEYGSIDPKTGNRNGIKARITPDMVGGPRSDASTAYDPLPGWINGSVQNRAHLLGSQLGGSGKEEANLVSMYTYANSPVMRQYEGIIRNYVQQGNVVYYVVKPQYVLGSQFETPIGVTIQARGTNGFRLEVSIRNVPH